MIFKPTDSAKCHELEHPFNCCDLTREDKIPDEWFAKLENIRLQLSMAFSIKYDEEKMVSHILTMSIPKSMRLSLP
jgi:hypothetical protein